jgi:hypothetical protein
MQKSCVNNISSYECGIDLLKERRRRLCETFRSVRKKIIMIDKLIEMKEQDNDQKRS